MGTVAEEQSTEVGARVASTLPFENATRNREPRAATAGATAHPIAHRYRPEIDGLRAIAVVPVIFFHAGYSWFSGGYVGVDIFFVISGYLITSIIVQDARGGSFSIARFYERRARRILPALFMVMAVCLPVAWSRMLPAQLKSFSQTLVAVPLFVSNVLFWLTGGYFDVASEEKPLLHTWSLCVEEQFYLLFPLLIAWLWPKGTKLVTVIIIVATAVSFGWSDWASTHHDVSANFFLAPSRAWEMLSGSMLAMRSLNTLQDQRAAQPVRELLSMLGLALIVASIIGFDATTPFPGRYALPPIVGTLLILAFAGSDTWIGRLLSLKSIVRIGLVSYSAYLIHQPLFAFARIMSPNALSRHAFGLLCMATFVLAYASWRFVERPFRASNRIRRRSIFIAALVGSSVFVALGAAGHVAQGFPDRWGHGNRALVMPEKGLLSGCPKLGELRACTMGAPNTIPTIAVIGDSHAEALSAELGIALAKLGLAASIVQADGCHPISGLSSRYNAGVAQDALRCSRAHAQLRTFIDSPQIDTVIVTMRWTIQLFPISGRIDELQFDNGEGGVENDLRFRENVVDTVSDGAAAHQGEAKTAAVKAFLTNILSTRNVILVYPVPEVGWSVPKLNLNALIDKEKADPVITTSWSRFVERNAFVNEVLDSVDSPRLFRVKPQDRLCNTFVKDRCVVQWGGTPLYFDDDHLSKAGSKLVVADIVQGLNSVDSATPK